MNNRHEEILFHYLGYFRIRKFKTYLYRYKSHFRKFTFGCNTSLSAQTSAIFYNYFLRFEFITSVHIYEDFSFDSARDQQIFFAGLSKNRSLEIFYAQYFRFEGSTIAQLLQYNSSWKSFKIDHCFGVMNLKKLVEITKALQHNQRLKLEELKLSFSDIQLENQPEQYIEQQPFQKLLQYNRFLRTLSLSGWPLADIMIKQLIVGFQYNKCLENLDLSDCAITAGGLEMLCQALVDYPLYKLKLSEQNVNTTSLNKLLRLNNTLKNLILADCHIADHNLKDIFIPNLNLTQLDLSGNKITAAGFNFIAMSIASNNKLSSLDLSSIFAAGDCFEFTFKTNSTLTYLNLVQNNFSQFISRNKHNQLLKNMTLKEYCLSKI